jgi:hypothetical protein
VAHRSELLRILGEVTADPFVSAPASLLSAKTPLDVLISPVFLAEASLFVTELFSVAVTVTYSCCKSLPKRKSQKAAKGKAVTSVDPEVAAVDAVSTPSPWPGCSFEFPYASVVAFASYFYLYA